MKRFILAIFCVVAVAASFLAQVQPGKLAGLIQAGPGAAEIPTLLQEAKQRK